MKVTSSGANTYIMKAPQGGFAPKPKVVMSASLSSTPITAVAPNFTLPPLTTDDLLDFQYPLPNLNKATINQAHQMKWTNP